VVNFAAETHVVRSIEDATKFVAPNVEGVRSLLSVIRDYPVDIFVLLSTDEVYGEIRDGKFKETDKLAPRNPYSATKAAADHLVKTFHETHGIRALLVRPSKNFGPRQHAEKLIPKLIWRAKRAESLPIYGDGTNVREWTYVRDTARAIAQIIQAGEPGEVYNVGSGDTRQNIEVAKAIVELVDASEDLIEFVEDRISHDHRYALNSTKLRPLGWEPHWSFEDGLRETIDSLEGDDH
jgi:dTDP-glucose 4,6-dehydratase